MQHRRHFYIDGAWVEPAVPSLLELVDPATEEAYASVSAGSAQDVDRAVAAARAAFPEFAASGKPERLALLRRILELYNERFDEIARAVTQEMGAPTAFARDAQAFAGQTHLEAAIAALGSFAFEERRGGTRIAKEAIGVVAMITPWNWPLNQIVCKVAPAVAAGCTMVLKPSEIAPLSGLLFAELMHAAGCPAGVFNLVNGTGPVVGQALAEHRDVDMVSFTGSTRAGIAVAKAAADTVKRVTQELGGKSANIILPDADLGAAVRKGVEACFGNSGQSCDAPSRMLVPRSRMQEAMRIAREAADAHVVGAPDGPQTVLGPVVSQAQFDKIQRLIEVGLKEGATLVAGGAGRPEGLERGYFVRPTVFGHVTSSMTVAREEIFGPVLSIMSYEDEDDAVSIANDSPYGLAAYVQSSDVANARKVAARLRAGQVQINYPDWDTHAPFGGFKQSGNGRECSDFGIAEFLELKAVIGYGTDPD